jgi:hypothetical protein
MKKFLATIILVVTALTTACVPPYRQTFNDAGKEKGWTQKQTDAAFAEADKYFWSRELSENKYIITYGKIPTAKVREQLEGVLKDLDAGLDPKNAEMKQYLDTFNLRKDMEHDEEITQAIYDRVRASELQTEFKQKMGDTPEYGPEAEMAQGYSARRIYVDKPLVQAFPFTSDVLDAAKKNGNLKQIAQITLDETNQYDHKEANPKNPEDENDFIWKARNQKLVLTEYKVVDIDKPLDNKGDYIEGYRVRDGKQEQFPAIKVFFPPSGSMALLLVDADEDGMPGFGIPDLIESIESDVNLQELIQNNELLNSLFDKKEAKKSRVIEQAQLFKVEIAPLGAKVDEWQKAPSADGWIIPFKYANMLGDNYNVRIKYKQIKADLAANGYPNPDHAHSMYMEIEYIEKEYTKSGDKYEPSAGKVLEYYRPKKDYSGKVKARVLHFDDTKKIQFEFEDGTIVDGFINPGKNKFIEDEPYAKSYNEGQKRWWIEKSEGFKVYDKRKSVGQPKESTGSYSDSEIEDAMRGYSSSKNPFGMDMKKPNVPEPPHSHQ